MPERKGTDTQSIIDRLTQIVSGVSPYPAPGTVRGEAVAQVRKFDSKTQAKFQTCVAQNYNLPKFQEAKGAVHADKKFWSLIKAHGSQQGKKLDELEKHSAVLRKMLKNVFDCKLNSQSLLDEFYKSHPDQVPKNPLRFMKQYIFTDLNGVQNRSDMFGADLIADLLVELYGYVRVNDRKPGQDKARVVEKQAQNPKDNYRRILVYSKNSLKGLTDAKKSTLIDRFNAPSNADGKDIYLFINSGIGKEGLSVKRVGFAHMFGLFMSTADMQQAAARVIRNCSSQGYPFIPKKGWEIQFFIYQVMLQNGKSPREIAMAFETSNKKEQAVRSSMLRLLQENAFDKQLLAPINKQSAELASLFTV